jgi:hypothetical protein
VKRRTAAAFLAAASAGAALERLESAWADLAEAQAQVTVTEARGATSNLAGVGLPDLRARYAAARTRVAALLPEVPPQAAGDERRALDAMRDAFDQRFAAPGKDKGGDETPAAADCRYDPEALAAAQDGLETLRARIYGCYGKTANALAFDGETLDRLTILARLGQTSDPEARRRLFLALDPLWRTVNADGGPESPYRRLVALTVKAQPVPPLESRARELGLDAAGLERGLVSILEAWRDATPPDRLEPWDYWYANEAASRALAAAAPRERLRELSDAYYRSLGADPDKLGLHFDLDPRPDKTPVAFTDFGSPARLRDGSWSPGEFWIFATYRSGGFGNLEELLHETGHGIHIAAIRTRPAYATWPDSDPFTEALADVPALEAYEPEWQGKYLGAAADLSDSLRSKYGSIVMDVAWALFEVRMQREPGLDPNRLWTSLTGEYLRIAPHPELSWWAMRGQLVDAPGYMTNYAIGAILAADMRARCAEKRGPFRAGDPGYYAWLSQELYRFGLERPSREVLHAFLGREPSPAALLQDLSRIGRRGPPGLD